METITMYELLGMVKDGKAPKKIKYHDNIYFTDYGNWYRYYDEKGSRHDFLNVLYEDFSNLNEPVEILEEMCHKCHKYPVEYNQTYCEFCLGISKLEEKKIPEKIEYYHDSIAWVIDDVGQLSDVDKVIIDKLNDVIDYLKSKGE